MPEEALEVHELYEQALENREHIEHLEAQRDKDGLVTSSAILASFLAVAAALASLFSGHAANEGILLQSQSSDHWSYYQAKSTKQQLFESNRSILNVLDNIKPGASKIERSRLDAQILKYESEKREIKEQAEKTAEESALKMTQHTRFSYAVASLQTAIVLSSLAILVRRGEMLFASAIGGIVGLILLATGWLIH